MTKNREINTVLNENMTFDLSDNETLDIAHMSEDEIYIEIVKGLNEIENGKGIPFEEAFEDLKIKYRL